MPCRSRLRGDTVGALNLFGSHAELLENDLQVGQSLADMATIGILQHRSSRRASIEAEQLQQALAPFFVIEQAKGVLAEFSHVDMEVAFGLAPPLLAQPQPQARRSGRGDRRAQAPTRARAAATAVPLLSPAS